MYEGNRPPPPPPIASEKLASGRKLFYIDLRENNRGRFFKITEDVGGRRDTILLPSGAAKEMVEALKRLREFEAALDPLPEVTEPM